jgi:DNA polymerase beta
MSNDKIINEFKRLIAYLKDQGDTLKESGDKKALNQNQFRVRQLGRVLSILKNYPDIITLKNYKELLDIKGIGKGSVERVKEILDNGKLGELGDYVDEKQEKAKIIEELEDIVGVGHVNAVNFYKQGITSVKMLKKKVKNGEIEVNDKVQLGLKYHNVYKKNIPRAEVTKVYKLIEKVVNKINNKKEYTDKNKYIFEICGSYRRQKTHSNDVDILITKKGTKLSSEKSDKHLVKIVKRLKSDLNINNGKPLLLDDMTDKNITTKYMGFSKYKDCPVRRIDIRFVPYEAFGSAMLYFTGSGEFNVRMRNLAKDKGYKLSEYGLFDSNEKRVKLKTEKDIFKFLGMEYVEPKNRH